jgi:hypothetical protein
VPVAVGVAVGVGVDVGVLVGVQVGVSGVAEGIVGQGVYVKYCGTRVGVAVSAGSCDVGACVTVGGKIGDGSVATGGTKFPGVGVSGEADVFVLTGVAVKTAVVAGRSPGAGSDGCHSASSKHPRQ